MVLNNRNKRQHDSDSEESDGENDDFYGEIFGSNNSYSSDFDESLDQLAENNNFDSDFDDKDLLGADARESSFDFTFNDLVASDDANVNNFESDSEDLSDQELDGSSDSESDTDPLENEAPTSKGEYISFAHFSFYRIKSIPKRIQILPIL